MNYCGIDVLLLLLLFLGYSGVWPRVCDQKVWEWKVCCQHRCSAGVSESPGDGWGELLTGGCIMGVGVVIMIYHVPRGYQCHDTTVNCVYVNWQCVCVCYDVSTVFTYIMMCQLCLFHVSTVWCVNCVCHQLMKSTVFISWCVNCVYHQLCLCYDASTVFTDVSTMFISCVNCVYVMMCQLCVMSTVFDLFYPAIHQFWFPWLSELSLFKERTRWVLARIMELLIKRTN